MSKPGKQLHACFLFIPVLFVLFYSCQRVKAEEAAVLSKEVHAVLSVQKEIPDEIAGFGYLSQVRKVEIKANQEAFIQSIPFREGTELAKGSILVKLENPQIQLAVQKAANTVAGAEAALALVEARLIQGRFASESRILELSKNTEELAQAIREYEEKRRKHLQQEAVYEAGGISEEAIRSARFELESFQKRIQMLEQELAIDTIGYRDQDLLAVYGSVPDNESEKQAMLISLNTASLQAEKKAAEAALEAAEKELASALLAEEELVIRSPCSAVIGARYVETGERVRRDDPLLTLIDAHALYAIFPVRESEALRLRPGMTASVEVEACDTVCTGTVELVAPSADTRSYTFSVRVFLGPDVLTGKAALLKPGMFARVRISAGPAKLITTVPESTLVDQGDDAAFVYTIRQNRLASCKLELGSVYGTDREVISGLGAGSVIVDKPDTKLKEGDYVTILD